MIRSRSLIGEPPPLKKKYAECSFNRYRCFYLHRSRDSVSPLCGILYTWFYQNYHIAKAPSTPKHIFKDVKPNQKLIEVDHSVNYFTFSLIWCVWVTVIELELGRFACNGALCLVLPKLRLAVKTFVLVLLSRNTGFSWMSGKGKQIWHMYFSMITYESSNLCNIL